MSERYSVEVAFIGRDNLSPALEKAEEGFQKLGMLAERVLAVGLGISFSSAIDHVKQFVQESIQSFAEFEQSSVKLAGLARQAGQDVGLLAQAFRTIASAMARDFAVAGHQAMDALESLVKAGLSADQAVKALGGTLALAKIEGVGFAQASTALVQVMAQFGVAGQDAVRVVDTLTNASRLGIGSATDFANGLANVGATAKAMGLSLEDAVAWLVALERRFGSAQEAGTILNRLLLELGEIARRLGVAVRDSEGKLRNMNDVILEVVAAVRASGGDFATLQEKLKGVDMRALKALFTLAQMTEKFEDLRGAVGQAGTVMETLNGVMNTTQGSFERMQAEIDRMQRGIGAAFSGIAQSLGSVFLPAVNLVMSAWSGIIAHFSGNTFEAKRAFLEFQMTVGRFTEQIAGEYILAWYQAGEITLSEALKMAETLGILTPEIQELISNATEAGVEVPQAFQTMASAVDTTRIAVENLQTSFKNMVSDIGLVRDTVNSMSSFYDVVLNTQRALGMDVQLTEEAKQSKERLGATTQLLTFISNNLGMVQQALQLYMLGGKEAGDMLVNTLTSLTSSMSDGIITNEEFVEILRQLGVDSQNVAGSLHNILMSSLQAVQAAVESNIDAVQNFAGKLIALDGMTVHTYHYHHQITVTESRQNGGGGETVSGTTDGAAGGSGFHGAPGDFWEYQRGAWYTPEGPAYLHRGEMVLPRPVAEWFRQGGGVGNSITVNVSMNVSGVSNPDRLAEVVSREIVRRLRAM